MKYTFEDFKKESIEKFGDIFDYSESEYIKKDKSIKIKCLHGHEFYRSPHWQLNIGTCPKCKNHRIIRSTEEFINYSKQIHNSKFNYEFVVFENLSKKVHLVCNDCGEHIYQTPNNNLLGNGCAKCARRKVLTKEQFVEAAQKKHGDSYLYENVEYKNMNTKVEIWCKKCQKYFYQDPAHHLRYGCLTCGGREQLTQEEFIKRSLDIYQDIYDYSESKYVNSESDVKIWCKKCQKHFYKKPRHFIHRKQGCPTCSFDSRFDRREYRRDEYIKICTDKFGDSFDYSLVPENVRTDHKIKIFCKKCQKYFHQILMTHMKSVIGCSTCAKTEKISQEEFLKRATKIHTNDYDYSKSVCDGVDNKLIIICNKCKREFLMTPYNHIAKRSGCIYCTKHKSKGERFVQKYLESNNIKFEPQYKIPECRNVLPLPFDFAIFNDDGSLFCLCEFHGVQHYKIVKFPKMTNEQAEKNFEGVIFRDTIKKEYCEKNQIKILYISYKQLDEIEEILSEYLKLNSH